MNSKNTGLSETEESEPPDFPVLLRVIKSAGRERLRRKLNAIGNNYSEQPKIAGVKLNLKARLEELFFFYFSPYENLITVRNSKPGDKLLHEAMSLYSIKNYPEAVKMLRKQLINKPGNILITFYLGISLLGSGNYKSAAASFRKIINSKNSLLYDHAKWYLALTYLQDSQLSKTVAELNEISKESAYFRKAGNLKKKIAELGK